MKRFFRKFKLVRKAKKMFSRSREEYEMQTMSSERIVLEQPSSTVPSPIPPSSPPSSEGSMATVAESPSRYRDVTIISSGDSESWVTADPGDNLTRVDTTEPAPVLHVQQECNAASSDGDGEQSKPGAFGPVLTGQSATPSSQPEASSNPSRVSSRGSAVNERLLEHAEPVCRRSSGNTEDKEDSDVDLMSFYVEDPVDTQQTVESPPPVPRQPSRHTPSERTFWDTTAEEFDLILLRRFDAGRLRHSRQERKQSDDARLRAEELAGLEALSDDLRAHPFALEVLIGREPGVIHNRPQTRPIGPMIISTQPAQSSTDYLPVQTSTEDFNDTSSSEPLSSHSSDEFGGIANTTPADDERWKDPAPLDLRFIDQELRVVAQQLNQRPQTSEAGSSSPPLDLWENRWNRYRFRNPTLACNHDRQLRYFVDEKRPDRGCEYCGRVYRVLHSCVSDTADYSGYDPDEEPRRDVRILSQWMQKAIAAGEYTPEQVERLLDDKIRVLTFTAWEREEISRRAWHSSQREGESVGQWRAREAARWLQAGSGIHDDILDDPYWQPCRVMACPPCLRGLTERVWALIDEVASEPYQPPPWIPEYVSRPVSDAATLQAIPRAREPYTGH